MSDEFKEEIRQMSINELLALAVGTGPADLRDPFPPDEDEEQGEEAADD